MLLPAAMAAGCDEARAAASTTELHHQQHHQHHHQQQCCERVDSVAPTHEVQASQSIEEAVVQNGQPFCRWPRHPDLTRDVDHRRPWVGSPRITHNMVGFENGRKGSCPSRIPRRIGPASRDSAAEARVRRRARPQPLAAEETNGNMGRRLQDRRPPPRQQGRPAPASQTASPRPAPVRRRPTTSQAQSPTQNEMSPTKAVMASPIRCASRGSSNSDNHTANQALNSLLYSPEDTINNDFFYDDEFSVPFDANLGENTSNDVDVEMLDSVDINTLLTLSRVFDDNSEPFLNRFVTSKSDTCLFQQLSSSGDMPVDVETSGDQSMSDQCASSTELSELRSEPLFSPPPSSNHDGQLHHYSTDSLGRDEPLSGSFGMGDDAQYTYDWSANKVQYMLSFDNRGQKQQSDDDSSSYHDSIPSSHMASSLTSWAQKSKDSTNIMVWGSRDSLGRGAISSGASTPAKGSPKHGARYHREQPLTSWSKLKEDKSVAAAKAEKLTTWRSLRETQKKEPKVESPTIRSKSMPDLKTKEMKDNVTITDPEGSMEPDEETDMEDGSQNKPSTTSLLELFQRLKSQEDVEEPDMMSSSALQQLTGAWSMSPLSTDHSEGSPHSETSHSGPCLTSWSTLKDLTTKTPLRTSTTDSIDSTTPDKMERSGSLQRSSSCQTKMYASFACNTSFNERQNCDAQCGSDILTRSLVFGRDNKDFCGQFPPNARDCSVQTSFEDVIIIKKLMNKSLQTSLGSSTESTKGELGPPQYQSTPQQTSTTKEAPKMQTFKDIATKQQETPKTDEVDPLTQQSLTNSLLYSNSALPDLSFLNKGMTQSINSLLEQASKTPPLFNPRMARADTIAVHVDLSIGRDALFKEKKNQSKPTSQESGDACPGGRHRKYLDSTSSASVCSSSSSGIDSGSCYESQSARSTQYFSDLGLFSPCSSDSSTLSESSSSTSTSKEADYNMPRVSDRQVSAVKVQDPALKRVKEVTSFAELASKQEKAVNNKLDRQACVENQVDNKNSVKNKKITQATLESRPVRTVDQLRRNPDQQQRSSQLKQSAQQQRQSGKRETVEKQPVCKVCEECQAQAGMVASVPVYTEPVYRMVAKPVKRVDYLQVSPTHKPYRLIGIPPNMPATQRVWCTDYQQECPCGIGSNQQKKPLKSCLVKRRRVRRSLFKHRSFSDRHDLAVMKYSQEGQTRYQLIAPPCEHECVHGLSMEAVGCTSLPVEVLESSLQEKASKRLSQQDLQGLPLHKTTAAVGITLHPPASTTLTNVPPNSTDLIPVMPCPCQCGNASLTSHSSDDSCSDCAEAQRHKKSVSFSEEVFYHSPYNSPHGSPKKPRAPLLGSQGRAATHPAPGNRTTSLNTTGKPLPVPSGNHRCNGPLQEHEVVEISDGVSDTSSDDSPPSHFMVSPSNSPPPGVSRNLSVYSSAGIDLTHKRELVLEVMKAAELVLAHFTSTRDPAQKMRLGSTAQCPEVGQLVLKHLCPAIHAILLDGLKPHIRSLFGRMRNSVWKVVEDSAEPGPSTRVINQLVRDLKNLDFLSTNWLKVNAFIFGLMNHKALDFWITYIHNQESLLSRHYDPESFLYLSATAGRKLLLDLTTALQPLAQLPLRLEYHYEYNQLQQQEQRRLADYLLDKHVAEAEESHIESHQALINQQNMYSEQTQAAAQSQMAIAQTLGQQTQGLLQVGTKRLLGKIQQHGTLMSSITSVLPRGRTKAPSPTSSQSLPNLQEASRAPPSSSGQNYTAPPPDAKPNTLALEGAVQVVHNNEVLDSTMDISDSAEDGDGLFSRLAKQVKHLASPEKVYKRGITEYQFDDTLVKDCAGTTVPSGGGEKPRPVPVRRVENTETKREEDGEIELPPAVITNSNTDSGIDQIMMELPPTEFEVMPRQDMPQNTDPRKRWSDTAAKWMGMESTRKVEVGLTEVKKRWSSFGSSMIKLFDKLILDQQGETMESPPWEAAGTEVGPQVAPVEPGHPEESRDSPEESCDWRQCETLVDIEQALSAAPAGVQVWTADGSTSKQQPQIRQTANTTCNTSHSNTGHDRYVEALCALVSMAPDQLSFKPGQRMKIIRQVEDDLLLCCYDDQQGLVHSACVRELISAEITI